MKKMRRAKRRYKEKPMSLGIKERPDGGAEWFLDNHKPREGNIKWGCRLIPIFKL